MRKSKFNILIISFFLSIVISCGIAQKNNKQEEIAEQNIQQDSLSFMKIISVIPDIKLPYSMWCGIENNNSQYPDAEELGSNIAKLAPEYSVVVGKLPINNGNTYVLFGIVGNIIYPILNTYDKNGYRIDSLYLHIGYCAGDNGEIKSTATIINKDFSISMTDTNQYYHYESDESDEKIIDSVIVKTRKMNLTKDGYYKITKESRKQIMP